MDVEYIDDNIILRCVKGEKIIEKFIAFSKNGRVISRFFGIPFSYGRNYTNLDFDKSIKIQGNHVDVYFDKPFINASFGSSSSPYYKIIPLVIYKTDRHVVIAPNKNHFNMLKIIYDIIAVVLFFILSMLFLFSLFTSLIIFVSFAIFFSPFLIYFYLFSAKKDYIMVGSIDSLTKANESTIHIKGKFDTGIPSFITKDYDVELYVDRLT